jgi:hypothetical protein
VFEIVNALSYQNEAAGGVTCPSRMLCEANSGKVLDVFVKSSGPNCTVKALTNELIVFSLAKGLGIPVAQCVLVAASKLFLDALQSVENTKVVALRMRHSVMPLFGSVNVGAGFRLCSKAMVPEEKIAAQGVELWAFDELVLNPDRRFVKPNCMTDGKQLIAIDHEKALDTAGIETLFPAVWQAHWTPNSQHLFFSQVKNSHTKLDRLQNAFEHLDMAALLQGCGVPVEWKLDPSDTGVVDYLTKLKANADAAFNNLKKAFL